MNLIATAMCIAPTLDWHGRSNGPIPVYDSVTLVPLGMSTGIAARAADGWIDLTFGGVKFRAKRADNGSQWWILLAVDDGRALPSSIVLDGLQAISCSLTALQGEAQAVRTACAWIACMLLIAQFRGRT